MRGHLLISSIARLSYCMCFRSQTLLHRTCALRHNLSPKTVDVHRAHIRDKLELKDVTALVRYATPRMVFQLLNWLIIHDIAVADGERFGLFPPLKALQKIFLTRL
ncbi:MAG: LuxR C-terminal-related transcriptional regulator [Candidatus Methylacidiphilales bacterium]